MTDFREHVKRAVEIVGSQVELARRIGVSQPTVHDLCHTAKSIRPELAKAIYTATGGRVKLSDLRPDMWPPRPPRGARVA